MSKMPFFSFMQSLRRTVKDYFGRAERSQISFVDDRDAKKRHEWAELSDECLGGGGTLWLLIKNALISLINNRKQRFMQTVSFHCG